MHRPSDPEPRLTPHAQAVTVKVSGVFVINVRNSEKILKAEAACAIVFGAYIAARKVLGGELD